MYEIWIVILSFIHVILGYPDGAPERACFYMTPRHTHPHTGMPCLKQTGPSPYRITVDNTTFRTNSPIRVTISGAPFKGFLIIAAEEGSKDWPSGVFYVEDPTKGRTVWCSAKNDAATHSNDRWKDSVTVLWYGPSFTPADMIRFVATVVTNRTTYWTDVFGPIMTQAQAQEGAVVGEGGAPMFGATGNDAWGYPTTASWMGRSGSRGFGGASGFATGSRGLDRFATGNAGENPTNPPAEGAGAWGAPRGGAGGARGAKGNSMNPFMRLVQSLLGFK